MVIIREIKTNRSVHYELCELNSGLKRKWVPPRNLQPYLYENVLKILAAELEKDSLALFPSQFAESMLQNTSPKVEPLAESQMTLKQYGRHVYMPKKSIKLAESTRAEWEDRLEKRIYPALGDLTLSEIRPYHITDFLDNLQSQGLSHGYVCKHYTILRSIFKQAYDREQIHENPMNRVPRPTPRKDESYPISPDAYTPSELAYILQCSCQEPLYWKIYIHLMAATGIRRGECCGIMWNDINFRTSTITIQRNVGATKSQGIYISTTKNQKPRTLPLSPELMEMLFIYSVYSKSKYLFPKRNNPDSPMYPDTVTGYFNRFGKKYNIPNFHPHKLRHSFASIAITNGADIASVSEMLGHHNKAFTLRVYTSASEESIKSAMNVYHNALNSHSKSK